MPDISDRRESLDHRRSESLDHRRKRLRYRCWHRGTKELDLLLGSFADRHLEAFDDGQLSRFEGLLAVPEPQIHSWLVTQEAPPPGYDSDVLRLLLAHRPDAPIG